MPQGQATVSVASENDRRILRDLARRVAEIASMEIQLHRTRQWRALNSLGPNRPMVLVNPEASWQEIFPPGTCQIQDPLLGGWEWLLRSLIYRHDHIPDDTPITGTFNIPYAFSVSDWGLAQREIRSEQRGSCTWDAPLKELSDIDKLRFRQWTIHYDETRRRLDLAQGLFGDILAVRLHGPLFGTLGLTRTLIYLRGLEQSMLDMYDNPQWLHRVMAFLRDGTLAELEYLQREGVLCLNNGPDDYISLGGNCSTDELPAPDFAGRVRLKDIWGWSEAQEFVSVSPEMFSEFALQYQVPVLQKFGLTSYGCCEPLDKRFDLLQAAIPNLRRVSVSPWCNRQIAAEKLGRRYVYSWKPNPALLAGPSFDEAQIEADIRQTLEIAKGCCVEMCLKDTHTVCNQPDRISRWTQIAARLAREYAY